MENKERFFLSNEDKDSWCSLGEEQEHLFLRQNTFDGVEFNLNSDKEHDKFTHDFTMTVPCDLKTIRTSWRTAEEKFGIPNRYAISINRKDVERYQSLYPNIFLILDVKTNLYSGYHLTDLERLILHIRTGVAKEHFYKDRVDDTNGNAKSSYVFDIRWFPELEQKNKTDDW